MPSELYFCNFYYLPLFQRIHQSLKPDKNWGPATEIHRKEWNVIVNAEKIQSKCYHIEK